ncbi:MAG: DUF2806 domain-containing protein [Verrucomicrobia bacterium]|nr:DUF2806 domain-containing protein [Verrucomicrobiota bacterium]
MRLAGVAEAKELLHEEIKTLSSIRRDLLEQYFRAQEPIERFRLKRDLDELAGQLRQIHVGRKALDYVEETQPSSTLPAISAHWLDKFNELARASNEPWREELLARALAQEARSPGSVVPRALWFLGTFEKHIFEAFSTLLDLSCFVGGPLMIPKSGSYIKIPIPGKGPLAIGNLIHQLQDVALIAHAVGSFRMLRKGQPHKISYHKLRAEVTFTDRDYDAYGLLYTSVGLSISRFYQPTENPLGRRICDEFIASLEKIPNCKVKRL